jgi:hypothetical protein
MHLSHIIMENNEESQVRKSITFGELIAVTVVIIGAVLMFWKTTDIRLSALEIRMNEKDKINEQISDKLDRLQDGVNDVKLTLKDKQDRKQ